MVSSLDAKFYRITSRNTSSNLQAELSLVGFWIEEMMKRWMESCTTISGRGWNQGFGAIFEDGDLGRDPDHDNKLKNGVGDVLALWDI